MWKTFAWPHHFNKRESLAHEASLTPPHFIEVSVPGKDGERLYICVLGISILSFLRNFYWILELLCGIFFYFFFLIFFFFVLSPYRGRDHTVFGFTITCEISA
jgi:hypothetical protein